MSIKQYKEDKRFELLRAFTHLTVFKTVPFSQTWVILHNNYMTLSIINKLYYDPYGTRTRVTAVKGRCLNRLTNGPDKKTNTEKEGFEPSRRVSDLHP